MFHSDVMADWCCKQNNWRRQGHAPEAELLALTAR